MRAHDDEALRELGELVHHAALQGIGLAEDGVQRRHDRHAQLAQQREDVAARLAAEDAVLVLHAHDVDGVDVQEVRRAPVRRDVALGDLEANPRRVRVTLAGVVHREHEAVDRGELGRDRVAEIGREGGDPALARQVVAEHRDSAQRSPGDHFRHHPSMRGRWMHLKVDSLSAPIEGKRTIDERYHTTPKYRMEFLSHRSILGTTSDKCIAVVQSPEAAFSEHSNSLGRFVKHRNQSLR